jgi:glycosyltransferase involved in cell wall biosynthesis
VDLPRVAVIIPARDEVASLPLVLDGLAREGVGRVVVVDNGSTDGTGSVARVRGTEVVEEPRKGYGRACLAGIRHLARTGSLGPGNVPSVVLFMDGDGSDDPADLRHLLTPIFTDDADMTVGVRRLPAGIGEPGKLRARLGTRFILGLARPLHGLEARDLGPFRAVRWTLLQAMAMDDETWGWTLQMQIRAHHLGARVQEVELQRKRRVAGTSKVSGSLWMSVRVGGKMGFTLLRERALRHRFRGREWSGAGPRDA